jgi:hypothetical protein
MVRLGGLWKNEKNGKTHLGGSLGQAKILIFPNGFKEKDTDPDFILYIAKKQKPEGGGAPDDAKKDEGGSEELPF